MSIWSISLDYSEPRLGDVTRLSYNSGTDLVTWEYRIPFTSSPRTEQDHGLRRFMAIRRIIGRKPMRKTSWRKHPKPNPQRERPAEGRHE